MRDRDKVCFVLLLVFLFVLGVGSVGVKKQNNPLETESTTEITEIAEITEEIGKAALSVSMTEEAEETEETEETEYLAEETSVTEEDREPDGADYSFYLKKIWIVDGWEDGADYPVSLVITGAEKGNICGYLKFDANVMYYYWNMMKNYVESLYSFQGTVYDGTAECGYTDTYDSTQGVISLTFCGHDRIEVKLNGNEAKQYLLRPYNISDRKFREELTTIEVELDSWGMVYLAYANLDSSHSLPWVMLINEQGDILYKFYGDYQTASMVCDVAIEDIDGDGLKDIIIGINFDKEDPTMFESYFYQEESGLFYFDGQYRVE